MFFLNKDMICPCFGPLSFFIFVLSQLFKEKYFFVASKGNKPNVLSSKSNVLSSKSNVFFKLLPTLIITQKVKELYVFEKFLKLKGARNFETLFNARNSLFSISIF